MDMKWILDDIVELFDFLGVIMKLWLGSRLFLLLGGSTEIFRGEV